MFKQTAIIALVMAAAGTAQAQNVEAPKPHWEFIVNNGTVYPSGAQREAIKRGKTTEAQLSYVVHPMVALTASLGWGRTRDLAIDEAKLDMFTYDVGAEFRAPALIGNKSLNLTPFVGAGAGGRTYNHRNLDIDATHKGLAYASAGGEIGMGRRLSLRIEARDYRTDVSVMAGMRVKVR